MVKCRLWIDQIKNAVNVLSYIIRNSLIFECMLKLPWKKNTL